MSGEIHTTQRSSGLRPAVIGVLDSGIGGLTVARRIRESLPCSPLLYFADTAHVPYGDRSPTEIKHFVSSITRFLVEHGAQVVVFACNTSSAYALEEARREFDIPIIGMIEPGARAAVKVEMEAIGVLATRATVASGVYTEWLKRLCPRVMVREVACPEFVPLVEGERTESRAAREASRIYLRPLLEAGIETIILGCTHYPLLLPVLREVAPNVRFVDPAEAVAAEVAKVVAITRVGDAPIAKRKVEEFNRLDDVFFASGTSNGLRFWARRLLPVVTAADANENLEGRAPDIHGAPVFDAPSDP